MFRLTPVIRNVAIMPKQPCMQNFTTWTHSAQPLSKYYPRIVEVKPPRAPKAPKPAAQPLMVVKKSNIAQSPWKMNFLVKLIRNAWVPDAMAQLKFSPKHRAVDVAKMVNRATAVARIFHEAIPEELIIKEVFVTKGMAQKRLRIMGRGRSGVGYLRNTHVTIKVEVIDFADKIEKAETHSQKAKWAKIEELVIQKRLEGVTRGPTMQAKTIAV